ncbi:hypothetical protein IMF23_02135 [Chelatococcus daeguensis]|uniref:Anti-sigma factor NepR domain-containing protein n=1 Tax=Chelatococcus sambhunathii TaxID=363953 RepID=A0ABM9U1C1_9HYPH|nr:MULTISPECIES: hypothetical protein [Chelatococcus]KZE36616.1 hypothetical protein AVW15_00420 [Chelatococcus daeguensis]MBM3082227.1 hypothetical protein [Chelatococcus daeguensis]CUA85823.1 hypothetical protein Ga0061061_102244 [Chelatococcus sambhunathii]
MGENIGKHMKEPTASATCARDIRLLLDEIEREPVPERLLVLALELQEALTRQRREKDQG